MQQTNTITPAAADVGAALCQAILAVLESPESARAAAEERAKAAQFSQEELERLEADHKFMAETADVRTQVAEFEENKRQDKEAREAEWKKIREMQDEHTTNVERFGESVRLHDADMKKHDEEKKQLAQAKNSFANEYKELLDRQEENRKWEKDLTRREQALLGVADNLRKAV